MRRGTTAEHASFTGLQGEVTVNTTTNSAVVHDGVTVGGHALAKQVDVDLKALAASPSTTGTLTHTSATAGDALLYTNSAASSENAARFNASSGTSGMALKVSNSSADVQCALRVNSGNALDVYVGQSAGGRSTSGTSALRVAADHVGTISPTTLLGYGAGSGDVVTQITSRTTGVTLSKPTGVITLFGKAATAGLVDSFVVTNTLIAATDVVQLSMKSGTVDATDIYIPVVSQVSAGSFRISLYTPAATANEAPVINFALIKGAAS
jgi:hypothetical protein